MNLSHTVKLNHTFSNVPPTEFFCESQVVLGTPSNGCQGLGLCKVYLSKGSLPVTCPVIPAKMAMNNQGRLRMYFHKSDLNHQTIEEHFQWQFFQITETFNLPNWVLRKLALRHTRIEPGLYRIWETESELIVGF